MRGIAGANVDRSTARTGSEYSWALGRFGRLGQCASCWAVPRSQVFRGRRAITAGLPFLAGVVTQTPAIAGCEVTAISAGAIRSRHKVKCQDIGH